MKHGDPFRSQRCTDGRWNMQQRLLYAIYFGVVSKTKWERIELFHCCCCWFSNFCSQNGNSVFVTDRQQCDNSISYDRPCYNRNRSSIFIFFVFSVSSSRLDSVLRCKSLTGIRQLPFMQYCRKNWFCTETKRQSINICQPINNNSQNENGNIAGKYLNTEIESPLNKLRHQITIIFRNSAAELSPERYPEQWTR